MEVLTLLVIAVILIRVVKEQHAAERRHRELLDVLKFAHRDGRDFMPIIDAQYSNSRS